MKFPKLLLILIPVLLFTISCKKDCETVPDDNRIVGLWVGKYSGQDAAAPTINQAWEIKADGEIIVHDGRTTADAPDANKGIGTWTLNGTIFRCTYKFLTLTVNRSCQLNLMENDTKLVGFRGEDGQVTGNGQVDMTKE